MKLLTKEISYIQKVIQTAMLVGIDNVIIEHGRVSGIDEAKTVVLLQTSNVPDMSFGSICMNRLNIFNSRLDIVKNQDNFCIEAIYHPEKKFTRSLVMKGTGVRMDYCCANPDNIIAPRQVGDKILYEIKLNEKAVSLLQKGASAMDAKNVSIISNDGVSFELVDTNNDVFSHTFAEKPNLVGEEGDGRFVFSYPVKLLISLFNQNPENSFLIGKVGMLTCQVNGLNIIVLPRV